MAKLTRRNFGKLSVAGLASALPAGGVLAATVSSDAGSAQANPVIAGTAARPADYPAANGHRVIVVGGGWSGLSIARNLKVHGPDLDVVLVERRSVFISHPISGAWIAGKIGLEMLTRSYLDAAVHGGYGYLNASLIDLDRSAKRIFTDQGWMDYDDLVLAPGVDYNYASLGVDDPSHVQALKTRYPAGFVSASEHVTLHNKVKNFKGGLFLLNAPPGIYRCSATPYERACLIASVFKREKIKGKVVLIDSREEPAVTAEGFVAAFQELYPGLIEYMTSMNIAGVDPETKTVSTDFDDIEFEDAALYPRIRGARLLEHLGLSDPKSAQMEASIDNFTYNAIVDGKTDDHLYITGDCRPMPFSKSGGTAASEGNYVAKLIAARARGEQAAWESPHTVCFSLVNSDPFEAVGVDGRYRFDKKTQQWDHFENTAVNQRDEEKGRRAFEWAESYFKEMFG